MGRRKQNLFEDIADLSSVLPCWLSLLFAVLAYLSLHQFADLPPDKITSSNDLFGGAANQLYKTLAYFLQFIVPSALILGTIVSLIKTQKRFGFLATLKSLVFALIVSLAAVFLFFFWYPAPALPPETTSSAVVKKIRTFLPFGKKAEIPAIEQANPAITKKEYVFSEQEIAAVQLKLLKERQDKVKGQPDTSDDRQGKLLFEIQLNNGRTLFAKNATITGETLSYESESGLLVSMNMQDVIKVRKLLIR